MAMSVGSWFCLVTVVSGISVSDRQHGVPTRTPAAAKLEPLWTPRERQPQDDTAPPVEPLTTPEMLALAQDRHRRQVRGAEEEEQQSTFSQSYETVSVTTPQPTKSEDTITVSAGSSDRDGKIKSQQQNSSSPGLDGPFSPLAESSYMAYAILLLASVLLATGVVGNMAVMCIVWNNYYMRSAWNYLLASMAFWDFLVLVFCLPVVVLNQFSHRRIFGDITCCIEPYMEVVSLGITSFTLCALGIDRFHAATSSSQPKARPVERCRSVLLKLLLVWLAALLLSSPEIFLWQLSRTVSPSSGRLEDSCTITPSSPLSVYLPDSLHSLLLRYHQGRIWWCFGCYFCLPVLFTFLSQVATRNVNNDANSPKKHRSHDDHSSNHKRQQAVERQLNSTLLTLAVVYAICALPEHATNITLAYTNIAVSKDTAAMLALLHHFLLFLKSAVTPVLLLCLCKALRQTFVDCCCCCCQECQSTRTLNSADPTHTKPQTANESTIIFDKAKDTSAMLSISS